MLIYEQRVCDHSTPEIQKFKKKAAPRELSLLKVR